MADRVNHEPAYVLHHYDWSESSVIVEAFTRHYGRVALVAKGAKRPSSNFRPVLLPLQPLEITWGGRGEIRSLKRAEWAGGRVMPTGDALLAGYYVNELILRLLAREDVYERLYVAYADTVGVLAAVPERARMASALRAFELVLLRELGVLPALDAETFSLAPLRGDARYGLGAERGLHLADREEEAALRGTTWCALEDALHAAWPLSAIEGALAGLAPTERQNLLHLLRANLERHCGRLPLRTRQLARDLERYRQHA